VADHSGEGRDDEDDVAEEADDDTDEDGLESCTSAILTLVLSVKAEDPNLRPHFVSATIPPKIGMTYDKKVNVEVTALAATLPRPSAPDV
jgi:hypothetical protein